jgi:hypothetical protein
MPIPTEISNRVPIINTLMSIVIFGIAVNNVVVKNDEEKLKKYPKNMIVMILIAITAIVQLCYAYLFANNMNKSSSTLLTVNIITSMWLISLINKQKPTEEDCKKSKEDDKIEFYKSPEIIASVVSGLLVIVSIVLIYLNNKQSIDPVMGKIYDKTSETVSAIGNKTGNVARDVVNRFNKIQ